MPQYLNEIYLNNLQQMMSSMNTVVRVQSDFHGQVKQVKALLKNDKTALISPILNFQINSANVPITFIANNRLQRLFDDWGKNVNKGLNIDIPRGLAWVGEQYFRERWTSSMIIVRLRWEKFNDFWMPMKIWIMNGSTVTVKNDTTKLDFNEYFLGTDSKLKNTERDTILIRKPYNQGYDLYPTPYLVQNGALEQGLIKSLLIDKQKEFTNAVFPYYLMLKLGSDAAMQKANAMPTPEELDQMAEEFKTRRAEYDCHTFNKGLIGGHPYDFNMEEFIPDFKKIFDPETVKSTDRNILNAMGMIELKGISSTREEAILNPAVMVAEVKNAVLDYKFLWDEIVELIYEKNKGKYLSGDHATVQAGIIKGFLTDEMKTLIRSWWDRGVVGQKSGVENTTDLLFETQIKEREFEVKNELDIKMYPRVTQNQENNLRDAPNESIPQDKIPGSPESKNYDQAMEEEASEYLEAPYSKISELPDAVKNNMGKRLQRVFMNVVNESLNKGDSEEVAFKKAWATISNIAEQDAKGYWKLKKKD